MDDGAEGTDWTLDFDQVFENYANVREWNNSELLGFAFGNTATRQINNVLFLTPTDLDIATQLVVFVESSYSAGISFIGLLILKDVEYSFEIEDLTNAVKEPENFLRLYATTDILETRSIDDFVNCCYPLPIRASTFEPCLGFTGTFTMQLDWHIKLGEPSAFKEALDIALDQELQNSNYMCFLNSDHHLLFGSKNSENDITGFFKGSGTFFYERVVDFVPLKPVNTEVEDIEESKLVPVVRITKGLDTYVSLKSCVQAFTVVSKEDSEFELVEKLRTALSRTLYLAIKCISDYSNVAKQQIVDIDSYAFVVGKNLICAYYPRLADESVLRSCRSNLHRVFNLPFDRPRFRPSQSLTFCSNSGLLRNPHEKIVNYKPLGELSLVRGSYDYHHYLQNGYDDCGWGCAYRSLQTIWSWFNYQGFTDKSVPSHRDIQQSLVDCGDKEQKFVGTKQWIGSTELGYCLDSLLGIQSRIIATNSGSEVVENARQLALHFKTAGTPVMIGGGMLAHTILGIDFNQYTGECAFLVLDPHYTGEDVYQSVVSKGWCGWKPSTFWKKEFFYNLLLPIPPSNVI